ncbi:hypothetical protein FRC19_008527 [Serendipita sp. 401]|nr:hypothetical protein FRC19_008527 [Serendipita sp. 401]
MALQTMVLKTREAPSREYVDIRFSFMLGGGRSSNSHSPIQRQYRQTKIMISSRTSSSSSSKRSRLAQGGILERGLPEIYTVTA